MTLAFAIKQEWFRKVWYLLDATQPACPGMYWSFFIKSVDPVKLWLLPLGSMGGQFFHFICSSKWNVTLKDIFHAFDGCVALFVRHRTVILEEALEQTKQMTEDEVDVAFRQVLEQLLLVSENDDDDDANHDMDHVSIIAVSLSEHAKEMLHFLDQRLQVPRDMGMLPASTLRSLAAA
jgi:hypothetical protein